MAAASKQRSRDRLSSSPESPRLTDLRDWHCHALLALLAALFFRDILLGSAYFWEDFLYQNFPFRSFAATSIAAGQLPLWNPYTFGGMPFLADIQTAVFYLPSAALALAVHHGTLHHFWLELMVILHYPLAGSGMFLLARSFGMRRAPALFSGLAFMLSGFMITHAIHQQIVTLAAWYPLILLIFRHLLQEKRWTWVFAGAVVLGHSTLAGFPQLSLFLYLLLGLFFLFEFFTTFHGKELLSRDALTMIARAVALVILSLALASFQLLPTLELSPLSQRAEITYAKSTEGSLHWGQLLTFYFPNYFGTSRAEEYTYWGPGDYWHFWETCVYVGIPTLLLAFLTLAGIRRHKYFLFFWSLFGLSILYALGNSTPFHKLLFDYVPGFSLFRNPARVSVLMSLCLALLAGWGLEELLWGEQDARRTKRNRTILIVAASVGALAWILTATGSLSSTFSFLLNPRIASAVQKDMLAGLVVLLGTGALLFYATVRRPSFLLFALLFPALLFFDMSWFGGSQPEAKVNPTEYFSRSRRIVESVKREAEREFFRINTRTTGGMILDRNQGMVDRIFTMEGYTPLALKRQFAPVGSIEQMYDLMNVKYKTIVEGGQRLNIVPHTTYLPRAFFVYRMYVARGDSDFTRFLKSPEFDHRQLAVFEGDPGFTLPAYDSTPSWKATITRYENNEILLDVETSARGILMLSEMYYPGWVASVDDTRAVVHRVDYNLRGIAVPEGRHAVSVRFEPQSFYRGVTVSLAALAVCGIGFGISFRRHRAGRTG